MKIPNSTVALIALSLVLTACSSTTTTAPDEGEDAAPSAVAAAEKAALAAAGGEELGGTVSMLGVLGGAELDDFEDVIAPFERATGVKVQYEGSRDFGAVLQTRIDGGNPPDVVATPGLGQIADLADEGEVIDLRGVIGDEALTTNFSDSLIETGSRDGKVFGIFNTVDVGGLIWYDPKFYEGPTEPASWDELQTWAQSNVEEGETPWCLGLESGAASGWPAADFIDTILLRQAGPEFHEQWWRGEVPWTAPEVKEAFETYGELAQPDKVYGGTTTVLSTNFAEAAGPMFKDPPGCYLHQQATFMGGIITDTNPKLVPGEDLDFFAAPDFNTEFAGIQSISGEVVSMFVQNEQSEALVKYLATAEAASLVAATGRWLSPNKNSEPDAYENIFLQRASETLQKSSGTYTLGNSLMPQELVEAFWKGSLEYVQDPSQLDTILATLDKTRQETY